MEQETKTISIQELLRRQERYMRVILIMQTKLFETQKKIAEYTVKSIRKTKAKVKGTANPDILTSEKVCEMLGISKSTLYRLRTSNELPFSKVEGRRVITFNRKDVIDYINKHKKNV